MSCMQHKRHPERADCMRWIDSVLLYESNLVPSIEKAVETLTTEPDLVEASLDRTPQGLPKPIR